MQVPCTSNGYSPIETGIYKKELCDHVQIVFPDWRIISRRSVPAFGQRCRPANASSQPFDVAVVADLEDHGR